MTIKSVRALTAALVTFAVTATPALSYYPSHVGASSAARVSPRTQSSVSSARTISSTSSSMKPVVLSETGSTTTSSSKSSSSSSKASVAANSATTNCLLDAVEKREAAIMDSLDQFHGVMSEMLELREELLMRYWALPDAKKRASSLKTVWRTFGQTWRKAGAEMRDSRRLAWETFRDERSACGVYDHNDPEMGGLGADSQY